MSSNWVKVFGDDDDVWNYFLTDNGTMAHIANRVDVKYFSNPKINFSIIRTRVTQKKQYKYYENPTLISDVRTGRF